jgi:hypothetical protein
MNHTSPTPNPPRWLWHILVVGTLLGLVAIAMAAWILGKGISNPPRAANLIWTDQQLAWAGAVDPLSIAQDQTRIFTAPETLPNRPFSVEIEGRIENPSDELVTWGIWLETNENDWLIVAISGVQFVTARHCPINFHGHLETCQPLIEPNQQIRTLWKTFHHIRPIGQPNHIHLDYLPTEWADGLTLRLNDEWMWDIPYIPPDSKLQWGIWVQGGPESPSAIYWINAQIWQD